jgi:hypothetical protein
VVVAGELKHQEVLQEQVALDKVVVVMEQEMAQMQQVELLILVVEVEAAVEETLLKVVAVVLDTYQ